jgi:hypothetical protein
MFAFFQAYQALPAVQAIGTHGFHLQMDKVGSSQAVILVVVQLHLSHKTILHVVLGHARARQ